MKHPCSRCGTATPEQDLEWLDAADDFVCQKCKAKSEAIKKSWDVRRKTKERLTLRR